MRLHPIIKQAWRTVLVEAALIAAFLATAVIGLRTALAIYLEIFG